MERARTPPTNRLALNLQNGCDCKIGLYWSGHFVYFAPDYGRIYIRGQTDGQTNAAGLPVNSMVNCVPADQITAERQEILAELMRVFGDVRLGDGTSMHQARGADDNWHDDPSLRRLDPEVSWTALTPEKLMRFNDVFNFLNPEGFRFYLPAYLCCELMEDTCSCSEFFMYALCGYSNAEGKWELHSSIHERIRILTADQINVIKRVVEFRSRPGMPWARSVYLTDVRRAWENFWRDR